MIFSSGRAKGKLTRTSLLRAIVAAGYMLSVGTYGHTQPITFDTVALTYDAVPGADGDDRFAFFGFPTLNDSGQTAFSAHLTSADVGDTNKDAILSNASGTLKVVARTNMHLSALVPAPVFNNLRGTPIINNSGHTAFIAGWQDDANYYAGAIFESETNLSIVFYAEDTAPATDPSAVEGGIPVSRMAQAPLLNNSGQMAFYVIPRDTRKDIDGIALFAPDKPLGIVAQVGDVATSGELNTTITQLNRFGLEDIVLNNFGDTAFFARATGWFEDRLEPDPGIFVAAKGRLTAASGPGESSPDAGTGIRFSSISKPAFNDFGQLAYRAILEGDGVDYRNNDAIFSEGSGTLALVARTGDIGPSVRPEVKFRWFEEPLLSDSGRTTFIAAYESGASLGTGIFTEFQGTLELLAGRGDSIPGESDVMFRSSFDRLSMNAAGQIAFASQLLCGGEYCGYGLFATDTDGVLRTVVRDGQLFDANPDPLIADYRTISFIGFMDGSGGSDGRARSFNNAGQIAFFLNFTDGTSGVFVATIGVPEPSTMLLLVLGSTTLICNRKNEHR